MSDYFRQNATITAFNSSDSWVVLSDIEKSIKAKIEALGTPLKDWDISINYGIKTGYNEAFIISGEKRKELIAQDPKSDEIIRPILRGRDIKKYSYEFADLYLINTHNGIKEKNIEPIDVNDYPAIKKHLDKFYLTLERRTDKGITPYNLRNCAYLLDFEKKKIVWKAVGRKLAFSILDKGFYLTAPASFITSKFNLYLLAFLNSSFAKFFIYNNSDTTGAGDIMLNIQSLSKIPIPIPEKDLFWIISNLCRQILENKNRGVSSESYELEIDLLVYDIYQFTDEEINYIQLID